MFCYFERKRKEKCCRVAGRPRPEGMALLVLPPGSAVYAFLGSYLPHLSRRVVLMLAGAKDEAEIQQPSQG